MLLKNILNKCDLNLKYKRNNYKIMTLAANVEITNLDYKYNSKMKIHL